MPKRKDGAARGMEPPPAEFHEVARTLAITPEQAQDYSDALADVLCWFRGFRAANRKAGMPPGLSRLVDLNIDLKRVAWPDRGGSAPF